MENTLDAAVFAALRDLAVKSADLRAAKARFDALVRLRDLIGNCADDHHATAFAEMR